MKKNIEKEKKIRTESLKILAKKDVSSFKLKQKLLSKGFTEEEVDKEINELKEKKLVDDEKISARMVEKFLQKGKGYFYIKYHLNNEGIEPFNLSIEEEAKSAIIAIKQKKVLKKDLKDKKKKIKLLLFLSKRGFRQEAISLAIKNFIGKLG